MGFDTHILAATRLLNAQPAPSPTHPRLGRAGFLGLVWIKLLLPDVLRVVDAIPLSWRTGLTVATAIFMVANGVMTLLALENWYERSDGKQPTTATEKYFAEHFDNDYMANRFQSMQMNPNQASRIDQ